MKMAHGVMAPGVIAAGVALLAASAVNGQVTPPWSDDFESYNVGSGIAGQGGWEAWDDNASFDSFVSDDFARSGSKSLDISGPSDTVMRFEGVDCGEWTMTAYAYIPASYTGEGSFLLLNEYNHLGPYNWSTWVDFNASTGMAEDNGTGNALPYLTDEWNEIRVVINLDLDFHDFYLNGEALYTGDSWTEGWPGGGLAELQCLDLFANGATSVYYDDISVEQTGACFVVLDLAVDNLIGGENGTFTVTGAQPSNSVVILYAMQLLDEPVQRQAGNFCVSVGIAINFQDPLSTAVCQGRSDANGEFECTVRVPRQASGRTVNFQAFEANTCPNASTSNIVTQTIL